MAKPTIVTRAGKGSSLTWVEGDANFTNLQNATITVTDGTNSKAIDLNGTITFTAGTNVTLSVNSSTGAITINSTASGGGEVVSDTTPQLGGNLDVNGNAIVSVSNGNIRLEPNGTGNIMLTPSTGQIVLGATNYPTAMPSSGDVLTAGSGGQLSWTTPSSGGYPQITNDTATNATRYVLFDDITSGDASSIGTSSTKLTFNPSTGTLTATIITGTLKAYNEGSIYDLGTTGGTIAPNVANGNVQKITLNSALTMNAFTSPVAGQSLTLIIYGGTAYTSITSTMKFAGGIKTLTGTAGCIDILTVYYDGTNYFASLGKGFA